MFFFSISIKDFKTRGREVWVDDLTIYVRLEGKGVGGEKEVKKLKTSELWMNGR